MLGTAQREKKKKKKRKGLSCIQGRGGGETPGSNNYWLNRNRLRGYFQSCCATFSFIRGRERERERERNTVARGWWGNRVRRRTGSVHPHDCLPGTLVFISKLKRGRLREGKGNLRTI